MVVSEFAAPSGELLTVSEEVEREGEHHEQMQQAGAQDHEVAHTSFKRCGEDIE
jgi:hypothetical protein